jgi:hypothetical protein
MPGGMHPSSLRCIPPGIHLTSQNQTRYPDTLMPVVSVPRVSDGWSSELPVETSSSDPDGVPIRECLMEKRPGLGLPRSILCLPPVSGASHLASTLPRRTRPATQTLLDGAVSFPSRHHRPTRMAFPYESVSWRRDLGSTLLHPSHLQPPKETHTAEVDRDMVTGNKTINQYDGVPIRECLMEKRPGLDTGVLPAVRIPRA